MKENDKSRKSEQLSLLLRELHNIDKALGAKAFEKSRQKLLVYRRGLVELIDSEINEYFLPLPWWQRLLDPLKLWFLAFLSLFLTPFLTPFFPEHFDHHHLPPSPPPPSHEPLPSNVVDLDLYRAQRRSV